MIPRLLSIVALSALPVVAWAQTDSSTAPSLFHHTVEPSIGLTMQSTSEGDSDFVTAVWVAGLDASIFYDGEPWQLGAKLHAIYGEQVSSGKFPIKTEDDLIVSITPSRTILSGPKIRLFFETAAETQMANGVTDSSMTNFLDPVFVYQALFLGRRFENAAEDGSWQYDLTAGVGYALQETVAKNFIFAQNRNIVITQNNPLSSIQNEITLESGYSAIVDFDLQENLNDNFQWTASWKTVAINRIAGSSLPEARTFFENARVTSLLLTGLQYKFLTLSYTGELTYDRNVSLRRSLDESLVFGFKATL